MAKTCNKEGAKLHHSSGHQSNKRPKETWRRNIDTDIKNMGKTWKELKKVAKDRPKWRRLVSALSAT
jgi:hypothetical protein